MYVFFKYTQRQRRRAQFADDIAEAVGAKKGGTPKSEQDAAVFIGHAGRGATKGRTGRKPTRPSGAVQAIRELHGRMIVGVANERNSTNTCVDEKCRSALSDVR